MYPIQTPIISDYPFNLPWYFTRNASCPCEKCSRPWPLWSAMLFGMTVSNHLFLTLTFLLKLIGLVAKFSKKQICDIMAHTTSGPSCPKDAFPLSVWACGFIWMSTIDVNGSIHIKWHQTSKGSIADHANGDAQCEWALMQCAKQQCVTKLQVIYEGFKF